MKPEGRAEIEVMQILDSKEIEVHYEHEGFEDISN